MTVHGTAGNVLVNQQLRFFSYQSKYPDQEQHFTSARHTMLQKIRLKVGNSNAPRSAFMQIRLIRLTSLFSVSIPVGPCRGGYSKESVDGIWLADVERADLGLLE